VGSVEQLRPDARPVLTQVVLSAIDGHPIHARTALVASNTFPHSYEILSLAHLLHQLLCGSRAFGCWFRHEWFGPLVTADRGFTLVHRFQGQCEYWIFCRVPFMSSQSYLPLPIV